MKKEIHPQYRKVLFVDSSTGQKYICGSTLESEETEVFEGEEYPVCRVSVSSSSHPFYTGSKNVLDTEGRVDRFNKRYKASGKKKEEKEGEAKKEPETVAKTRTTRKKK